MFQTEARPISTGRLDSRGVSLKWSSILLAPARNFSTSCGWWLGVCVGGGRRGKRGGGGQERGLEQGSEQDQRGDQRGDPAGVLLAPAENFSTSCRC
jgi:hypothetical protein